MEQREGHKVKEAAKRSLSTEAKPVVDTSAKERRKNQRIRRRPPCQKSWSAVRKCGPLAEGAGEKPQPPSGHFGAEGGTRAPPLEERRALPNSWAARRSTEGRRVQRKVTRRPFKRSQTA